MEMEKESNREGERGKIFRMCYREMREEMRDRRRKSGRE